MSGMNPEMLRVQPFIPNIGVVTESPPHAHSETKLNGKISCKRHNFGSDYHFIFILLKDLQFKHAFVILTA